MPKAKFKPGGLIHLHRTVSDMKRAIDFYVTVLGCYYVHGEPEMAWLTHKHALLTITPGEPVLELANYWGWTVGSYDELNALYAEYERLGQRLSEAPDREQGRLYFFIYDPDGQPIALSWQPLED